MLDEVSLIVMNFTMVIEFKGADLPYFCAYDNFMVKVYEE